MRICRNHSTQTKSRIESYHGADVDVDSRGDLEGQRDLVRAVLLRREVDFVVRTLLGERARHLATRARHFHLHVRIKKKSRSNRQSSQELTATG